jgi:hypothetical protein
VVTIDGRPEASCGAPTPGGGTSQLEEQQLLDAVAPTLPTHPSHLRG